MHVVSVADSFEVSASVSPLRFAIPSRSTIWQIYFPRLAHSPSHAIDPRSIERASIHANARGWSNRWTTLPRIRRLADPAHDFSFRPFVSASPMNVRRVRNRSTSTTAGRRAAHLIFASRVQRSHARCMSSRRSTQVRLVSRVHQIFAHGGAAVSMNFSQMIRVDLGSRPFICGRLTIRLLTDENRTTLSSRRFHTSNKFRADEKIPKCPAEVSLRGENRRKRASLLTTGRNFLQHNEDCATVRGCAKQRRGA